MSAVCWAVCPPLSQDVLCSLLIHKVLLANRNHWAKQKRQDRGGKDCPPPRGCLGDGTRRSAQPPKASEIGGGAGSGVMLKGRSKENEPKSTQDADRGSRSLKVKAEHPTLSPQQRAISSLKYEISAPRPRLFFSGLLMRKPGFGGFNGFPHPQGCPRC